MAKKLPPTAYEQDKKDLLKMLYDYRSDVINNDLVMPLEPDDQRSLALSITAVIDQLLSEIEMIKKESEDL